MLNFYVTTNSNNHYLATYNQLRKWHCMWKQKWKALWKETWNRTGINYASTEFQTH